MLETLIPIFIYKSTEIIFGLLLEKFWKWILKDAHIQTANNFLKMRIIILYTNYLMQQISVESMLEKSHQQN
jgi:hypothetical protein